MKKSTFLNKDCTYCGNKATTDDHIPPKSFFPHPRPSNLITVPSCFECNNSIGKDIDYFLATFMFTKAGESDAGRMLWKERLNRMYIKNLGLRRKIAQNLSLRNLVTPHGIFLGRKMTLTFDETRIYKVVARIAKGFYHAEFGNIIPLSHHLDCLFLNTDKNIKTVAEYLYMLKDGTNKWPGVFQYKYNRTQDKYGSMWILSFYNYATFWLISYDPNDNEVTVKGKDKFVT